VLKITACTAVIMSLSQGYDAGLSGRPEVMAVAAARAMCSGCERAHRRGRQLPAGGATTAGAQRRTRPERRPRERHDSERRVQRHQIAIPTAARPTTLLTTAIALDP
jgi:hypothetical protein